jgi:hypothetical protein
LLTLVSAVLKANPAHPLLNDVSNVQLEFKRAIRHTFTPLYCVNLPQIRIFHKGSTAHSYTAQSLNPNHPLLNAVSNEPSIFKRAIYLRGFQLLASVSNNHAAIIFQSGCTVSELRYLTATLLKLES